MQAQGLFAQGHGGVACLLDQIEIGLRILPDTADRAFDFSDILRLLRAGLCDPGYPLVDGCDGCQDGIHCLACLPDLHSACRHALV